MELQKFLLDNKTRTFVDKFYFQLLNATFCVDFHHLRGKQPLSMQNIIRSTYRTKVHNIR